MGNGHGHRRAPLTGGRRPPERVPLDRRENVHAPAIVRHAGARYVVITDVNPFRLELARKMGVTRAIHPKETNLAEVQKELREKYASQIPDDED